VRVGRSGHKFQSPEPAQVRGKSNEDCLQWKSHSTVMRDKIQCSKSFAPWTSRPEVICGKSLPARAKDMTNVCFATLMKQDKCLARRHKRPRKSIQELSSDLYLDLAQAVQRCPWSKGDMRCLLQGSQVYSYAADGIFKPEHHLRVQGFGSNLSLMRVSDAEVRGMAGEAFFAPCIGVCLYAIVLLPNGRWWS
jgi:hypothetical protein